MDATGEGALHSYCCPSCSSRFLVGAQHEAQTCPYCGAELRDAGPTDPNATPQRIVPFAVPLEEAHDALRRHLIWGGILRGKPSVESTQAVYVPYCPLDVFVHGDVGFRGKSERGHGRNNVRYFHYRIRAHGYGEFLIDPMAASTGLPHSLAETVAPYDLDEALSFEEGLLATNPFETVGKSAYDVQERAKAFAYDRFAHATRRYVYETVREDFLGANTFTGNHFRIKLEPETEDWGLGSAVLSSTTYALPVWVLRCNWKGERHAFVVNGQTGKCAGGPCVNQHIWPDVDTPEPHDDQDNRQVRIERVNTIRKELNPPSEYTTSPDFAMSETLAPYDKSSWRKTAMYDFASHACEEYGRRAASYGLDASSPSLTTRRPDPKKRFVPIDEDPVSVPDDTFGNDPIHGFAITDAGLRCVPAETISDLPEHYFTSWPEYAWSDRPFLESRYGRSLIYSGGNVIAFCPRHARLRLDLMHLYLTLWQKARELFGWAWFVSAQPKAAAQVVMANTAFALCKRMTLFMGGERPRLDGRLHRLLRIGRYENVLLAHDNSRERSDNSAFAITAQGITCRGRNMPLCARFVGWEELSRASKIWLDGENVCAGNIIVACYDGDRSTQEALLALFEELHDKARKAYGGRTGLYMLHK